ncbi:coiled-coil domain-containing protein 114 [Scleropages formosus]|uniref:coiled-coil domain-containing protein 114 n=1 Tax=Scleropages formosus TaxID=113540 RepID=UPI000878E97D|nr:coiled-coil domain-containing protein 63-like [Scleropages formosus]
MPRGRSARSIHSDRSETDLAEVEMTKLQRQFRIMEGDRQAYTIQAQEQIRTQRLEIERLQEEQKELQCRLNVSQGHSLQQQDVAMRRLLNQQDEVNEQLERQGETLSQLEQEIIKMEKKLATLRRTGNIVDATQKSEAFEKQKATLENKLHHALVQFNEQLTKNAQLREDLEALRLQWIWFQQLQYKLDKELQEVHRDIGDMINQSTVTYDARVEAQSKMVQLKEKADKDLAQYSEEMKELESVIAHERRLKEFISTKSKERSSREDSLDPTHRQALEERERKRVEPGEEMLDSLEEVFHKIQSVTGEENLDLLASKFIQVEGQNFALFNYIIEQNNEAKSLRDQIEQIQQEMDQFHAEEQSQEAKYHKLLRDTDIQQREAEAQAQSYESQAVAANNILEQIKTGVDRMFRKLNCDLSALEDMLGSSTEIKDSNIMTYLSLIEKRTNELLSTQVLLSSKTLDSYDPKDVARILLGQSLHLPAQNISIQSPAPWNDHETEGSLVTDEDEWSVTQQDLRQRIMMEVLQKEAAAQSVREKDEKGFRIGLASGHRRRLPKPSGGGGSARPR